MKTLAFFLFIFTGVTSNVFSQTDTYPATLKKMLATSGAEAGFQTAIKQMISMFKQQKPDVPAEVWTEFEKEFAQTSLDDLVEMFVPVYKKHLTEDDLKNLTAFYETPVGKKFASKSPLIMQESMQVGQQWGAELGQRFAERMKAAGY